MKYKVKKHKKPILILISLAIAIIGMMVYLIFGIRRWKLFTPSDLREYNNNESDIILEGKPTLHKEPEKNPSDWGQYNNKELGIIFDYPQSWGKPTLHTSPERSSTISFKTVGKTSFYMSIYYNYGVSVEKIAESLYKNYSKHYKGLYGDYKIVNFTIDGHHRSSLLSYIFYSGGPLYNAYVYITASNNRIIGISYTYLLSEEAQKKVIIDRIVASIKLNDTSSLVAINLSLSEILVGVWQDTPVMAAGWSNRYQFFPSYKYNFRPSQMFCGSNDRGNSGYWKVDPNSNIEQTILKKVVLTQERKPGDFGECGSPEKIVDTPKEVKTIIVRKCDKSEADNYYCLSFNGIYFYRFDDDPTYGDDSGLEGEPSFVLN